MTVGLVLGDMLFDGLPGLDAAETIFMCEDVSLCTRVRHHQIKLVLFLSSMRHFRDRLVRQGRNVRYCELEHHPKSLLARLQELHPSRIVTYDIADRFFREELQSWAKREQVTVEFVPNPMFLTPPAEWQAYRSRAKRLLMGDFYVRQRRRMNILIESGEPVGGKWSFDEDNRKSLPKGHLPPAVWRVLPDETTADVIQLVQHWFPDHPGDARNFWFPVTHADATQWLEQFLEDRFDLFGPYEDALSVRSETVYHSILTPMLNCGLLTPAQVIEAALQRHADRPVPLASLEGFIRQIIGWREFIRGMGDAYPAFSEEPPNALGHTRRLTRAWWTGETGLPPLDLTIRRALENGYCHHIERLMVLGSAMLMCEVHPKDVYQWFMEMFVDSADWVMGPNVLGMSQFADGGWFATKPYLSGSSYLRKMGDYPAGPWTEVWDGLYWRCVDRHRELFAKNPRMSVMLKSLENLEPSRRHRIFSAAEGFVERTTQGSPQL
jgi:deoxyribodipyrimidine photolyase-related protein